MATLLLATTAYAQQAKESANEFDCSHLILGSPKSRSTSVARALCNALMKGGNTSCIHEPFRVRHEMDLLGQSGDKVKYKSNETTLCKEMLFHPMEPEKYQLKIQKAIKTSKNAVVILKSDPTRSFLSLVDLTCKELEQRYGNLKVVLTSHQAIDQLSEEGLYGLASIVAGNSAALSKIKAYAQQLNKPIVELEEKSLSNNPTDELNKVLTSWNKQPIPLNQKLYMSPNLYLDNDEEMSRENSANFYQLATSDFWDTAEGDVFDPSIRSQSRSEKVQALMNRYVPDDMHLYFKTLMDTYFNVIEQARDDAEKKYQKPAVTLSQNEL